MSLNDICSKQNSWCSYCNGNHKLCDKECNFCYQKSFASHYRSKFLSNKNTINARYIFKHSDKKLIFDCDKCNHEFEASLGHVTDDKNSTWCPYCSDQKLCENECNYCFNKSLASHPKSKYFSKINKVSPRQIFLKSFTKKYFFDCEICNHLIEKTPSEVYNETWCIYCSNKKLCNNNCDLCYSKSFASHSKAEFWSPKNKLKPRQVFKSSGVKFIFDCNYCHNEYIPSLNTVNNGSWCRCIMNKTEQKLFERLILIYPTLIKQYKVEWCKNIFHLPFDFCIEELKIIIELDGPQHFKQVSNWKSPEETRKNDKYKIKVANENKYSMIRILQEDVLNNNFDWEEDIKNTIKKIIDDKIIQNIFICKNNDYDIFNDNFNEI